ncbi:hypothetical protein C8F04DRAFT_1392064 [Mycena alexandri]|uniref:FBD domain-containing protein n=1 Tax=Mycena alexandri TaxID=1745969 RepID=A0AAD6T5F2_9AGAR|nr:hypothetical protein C8F04DRAFT_1392064 [Mycena alexandri]
MEHSRYLRRGSRERRTILSRSRYARKTKNSTRRLSHSFQASPDGFSLSSSWVAVRISRCLRHHMLHSPACGVLPFFCPDFFASDILENIDTPSLHELAISGIPSSFNRYPSLTSIELGRINERDIVDILHQCPQLLHLKARIYGPRSSAESGTITLLRLQSLDLTFMDLDLFTLPSLRCLDFFNPLYYHTGSSDSLLAFLKRSACVLDHIGLHFDVLVECLEAIPPVVSLSVAVKSEIYQFREFMTTDPAPIPYLRILAISAQREGFDFLSFIHLIRTRRGDSTTTRSESVHLALGGYLNDRDYWLPASARTEFERLIAKGSKLRVTFKGSSWPEAMISCETFPYSP